MDQTVFCGFHKRASTSFHVLVVDLISNTQNIYYYKRRRHTRRSNFHSWSSEFLRGQSPASLSDMSDMGDFYR